MDLPLLDLGAAALAVTFALLGRRRAWKLVWLGFAAAVLVSAAWVAWG